MLSKWASDSRYARKVGVMGVVLALLLVVAVPIILAVGEEGPLLERFVSGEGRYATVAGGAGLEGLPSNTVTLTVPGTAVVKAYLYWAGVNRNDGADDPNVSFQVDGGAVNSLTADVMYGPTFWYTADVPGSFNHNVYVEDVTSLVQLGTHAYTLSDYTVTGPVGYSLTYGFGLIVVYEDPALPLSNITLLDGLDSVYYGFPAPRNSPSQMNCITFPANATKARVMDYTVFVGGSEDANDTDRPNSLHYATGSGALPTTLVDPNTGNLVLGDEIVDPFTSVDGPAWDTYTNTLVVNAGDTWACFQTQSDGQRGNGASFLWLMGGMTLREQTPTAVSLSAFSANNHMVLPMAGVLMALTVIGGTAGMILIRRKR